MSARDVIARAVEDSTPDPQAHADYLVAELTAAGYRILGPDELDPVTVERCADVIDTDGKVNGIDRDRLAEAIRSLSPTQPEAKEARDGR